MFLTVIRDWWELASVFNCSSSQLQCSSMSYYIGIHSLLAVIFQNFALEGICKTTWQMNLFYMYTLWSFVNIGWISDRKPWTVISEIMRLVISLPLGLFAISLGGKYSIYLMRVRVDIKSGIVCTVSSVRIGVLVLSLSLSLCVCVFVCAWVRERERGRKRTRGSNELLGRATSLLIANCRFSHTRVPANQPLVDVAWGTFAIALYVFALVSSVWILLHKDAITKPLHKKELGKTSEKKAATQHEQQYREARYVPPPHLHSGAGESNEQKKSK